MRISDWSSDVCSSDLVVAVGDRPPLLGQGGCQVGLLGEEVGGAVWHPARLQQEHDGVGADEVKQQVMALCEPRQPRLHAVEGLALGEALPLLAAPRLERDQLLGSLPHLVGGQQLAAAEHLGALERVGGALVDDRELGEAVRSEEHTSELQSLMRLSYAVLC